MVCYSGGANLYSDWSKRERGYSINCIARIDLHCDWSFQIPVVSGHMPLIELRLIGTLKFLFLAQGLCPYTPDPFPLRSQRVGSGNETIRWYVV